MRIGTGPYINSMYEGLGSSISGRAVTAVLFVSPNGNNTDGSNWTNAYQTIQAALDIAAINGDCTLINIGPHPTFYDIDTTGDPTWSANVILNGTHRRWAIIKNTHASATSVFKFTGKASLINISVKTQGTVNGVIFTKSAWRVRRCGVNLEDATGACTGIYIDGTGGLIKGGILEDVKFHGHVTHSTGLHLNNTTLNEIGHAQLHNCLVGVHIEHADSDHNHFCKLDVGDSALGFDIDAGNEQHFEDITFHHNTRNVDDEVGDHIWSNIKGQFPIAVYPDDFSGITVASAVGAGVWGSLVEVVAAAAIDNPFRIVGYAFDPNVSQWSRIRFTADAGVIYFDDSMFDAHRLRGASSPSGTEFIFNKGTKIEAMQKVSGGGPDSTDLWVEIQEI